MAVLKVKNGDAWEEIAALKGDKGDPGEYQDLIDDTAGTGTTDRTWSANKLVSEFAGKADKADTVLDTTLSRGRKSGSTVGTGSLAFGYNAEASGDYAHAEGRSPKATGYASHAEGYDTTASGNYTHAEGSGAKATGAGSHAEGGSTTASDNHAHAEGFGSTASGTRSHAEGYTTTASGGSSHAENYMADASGDYSHAEGYHTTASGERSHAEGTYTVANHRSQSVSGEYNVADPSSAAASAKGNYVEIVGNGTGTNARSNARTLDWDGNERLTGDVYVGCNADSTGGSKLAKVTELPAFATDQETEAIITGWEASA